MHGYTRCCRNGYSGEALIKFVTAHNGAAYRDSLYNRFVGRTVPDERWNVRYVIVDLRIGSIIFDVRNIPHDFILEPHEINADHLALACAP